MSYQWKGRKGMLSLLRSVLCVLPVLAVLSLMLPYPIALAESVSKTNSFDKDPGWDGFRNRIVPEKPEKIRQSFGYSRTNYAGGDAGEIGGHIRRTITPATYAMKIPDLTLNDKLVASGKFALYWVQGNSGANIGWFNEKRQGFRGWNSMAVRFNGNFRKATISADCANSAWEANGAGLDEIIQADGKPHTWRLEYDPEGNNGTGTVSLQLDDLPPVVGNLPPGYKEKGSVFNRFGIFNHQVPGYDMIAYFDDVVVNGKKFDFSEDPAWEGRGNGTSFLDYELDDSQNFGFSKTCIAGGKPGEIGGTFWRTEPSAPTHGYYADIVGPLDMNDKLFASGKVAFTRTAVDSAMFIGWFSSEHFKRPAVDSAIVSDIDHLAVVIEGPSQIGHYFRPHAASIKSEMRSDCLGPVIRSDGKVHDWTISYDPEANNGNGSVTVTLDDQSTKLDLPPGLKKDITGFDRFGLFTARCGGHFVTVYFDDLKYTAGSAK